VRKRFIRVKKGGRPSDNMSKTSEINGVVFNGIVSSNVLSRSNFARVFLSVENTKTSFNLDVVFVVCNGDGSGTVETSTNESDASRFQGLTPFG
jgi:hypothetical protein